MTATMEGWLQQPIRTWNQNRYVRKQPKGVTCKDERAAILRDCRFARYKTTQQWQAKIQFEIVNVRTLVAALAEAKDIEAEFNELAEKWDLETSYLSSTPKRVLHDSYQSIMAMGPDVVPFLLRDLRDNRRSWFWALRHITQANPVPSEDQGNLDKMVDAWVAWGKREGRI
ncbi:MAG: hypothetical protein ACLP7O_06325 [Terracidiphilus sp.]